MILRRALLLSLVLLCALNACTTTEVRCEISPQGPIAREGHVVLFWTTLKAGEKPPCGKRGCATCMNGVCSLVLVDAPELPADCNAHRFAHELGHALGGIDP